MGTIFLIRHAAVDADMTVPAEQWPLSPAGNAAAERLAQLPIFAGLAAVYSSPEAKARATGAPLVRRFGLEVVCEPDLAELRRGGNLASRAAYEAAVAAAFAQPEQSTHGWERAADAQQRILRGVRTIAARHTAPVAIVSHGLVLSLLHAALAGLEHVELDAWRALPMPAIGVLDGASWQLTAPFSAIDTQA